VQDALRTESEDREELARLRAALAASRDILYEWDLTTDSLRWSEGAAHLLRIAGLEAGCRGEAFERRLNPEDTPTRRLALSNHLVTREDYDCEYRVRTDNGEFQWVHDRGAASFGPDGKPCVFTGVLRIVTARKEDQARLEYLASYDELTGHYNRTRLRESLDHALAYATRYGVSGGYLAIGIDKLGLLGEAFGYQSVNQVVVEVGNRLDRCLRASDVIGRAGDDGFGVILGQCREGDLPAAAEKILEAVRGSAVETASGPVHVTVSIGAVIFPDGARITPDVMAKADLALQAARQSGRDNYVCYRNSEKERQDHRRHVEIFEEVQAALRDGRLIFAYQPVVDAANNKIAFHECLLRMRRESGELVPAGQFIPVVENLGLIRAIDRRTLELAVADLRQHRDLVLAVNVSSITAFDRSWFRLLCAFVKDRPDIAERLIVEITETAAVPDFDEMAHFVAALRKLGCKVALDDFGAGYTSFRHLKTLTLDLIKIDGAFVRDVTSNLDNQLFIRTLAGLGEGFGLATVAECVETAEEAELLTHHGITFLQGYHLGRPTVEPAWKTEATPPVLTRASMRG